MMICKTGLEGGFSANGVIVKVLGYDRITNEVKLGIDAPREIKIERFKGSRSENVARLAVNKLH